MLEVKLPNQFLSIEIKHSDMLVRELLHSWFPLIQHLHFWVSTHTEYDIVEFLSEFESFLQEYN
jgi:hypothetical protein